MFDFSAQTTLSAFLVLRYRNVGMPESMAESFLPEFFSLAPILSKLEECPMGFLEEEGFGRDILFGFLIDFDLEVEKMLKKCGDPALQQWGDLRDLGFFDIEPVC